MDWGFSEKNSKRDHSAETSDEEYSDEDCVSSKGISEEETKDIEKNEKSGNPEEKVNLQMKILMWIVVPQKKIPRKIILQKILMRIVFPRKIILKTMIMMFFSQGLPLCTANIQY